jgi:hypothetical protein
MSHCILYSNALVVAPAVNPLNALVVAPNVNPLNALVVAPVVNPLNALVVAQEVQGGAKNIHKRQCPNSMNNNSLNNLESNDDENEGDSDDDCEDLLPSTKRKLKVKRDRVAKNAGKTNLRFEGIISLAKLIPSAAELAKRNLSSGHPFQKEAKQKVQQSVGINAVAILTARAAARPATSSSSASASSSSSSFASSSSSSSESPIKRVSDSNPLAGKTGEQINEFLHALHPQRNIDNVYTYIQEDDKNYMIDIYQSLCNLNEIFQELTEDNEALFLVEKWIKSLQKFHDELHKKL